jgi:Na+-driven multidrug efflux pump
MLLVSEMTWVLAETITTALYNGRGGAEVVSGMAAGFAIANLMFVAFGGVQSAIIVVLGSTLGAGRLDEARKQKTWLLSGTFVMGILMMFMALASTLLVPVVFGRLSSEANEITREVIILIALFMPVWLYLLGQLAVSRAGGDTAMGAVADALITVLVMVPGVIALALFTDTGPIGLYAYVRSVDFIRLIAFHFWLKREAWLKNLTEQT